MQNIPRKIATWAGSSVAIACCLFFLVYLWKIRDGLEPLLKTALILPLWLPSIALYSIAMLLGALLWRMLLKNEYAALDFNTCLSIFFISQFAKYIPGNVAQHAGRLYLSTRQNIPAISVAKTQIQEIAILALTAGTFFLALTAELLTGIPLPPYHLPYVLAAFLFLSASLFIAFKIKDGLPSLKKTFVLLLGRLDLRVTLLGVGYSSAVFCLTGLMTWLCVLTFSGVHRIDPVYATCAFATSWILGFITPGAPAGLGVRDALLFAMLKQTIPSEPALLACIAIRLTTSAGDLVCLVTGLFLKNKDLPSSTAPLSS